MQEHDPNWHGKWFECYGWRVFPRTLKVKIDKLVHQKRDRYHDQLDWSIKETVQARNESEACEIADEFLYAVQHASDNRPLLLETDDGQIRKHGWKHFTHDDLEYLGQRAQHPERSERLERMKPMAVKELILRAIRKIPDDVAFLSCCMPRRSDRQRIARSYFENPPVIPSAGDLAAEYVDEIYRNPKSPEAKSARKNLNLLISDKAVNGFPNKRGPKPELRAMGYAHEGYLVAQALARQLREVSSLLCFEKNHTTRQVILRRFLARLYPWTAKISVDEVREVHKVRDPLPRLLELVPSEAARFILRPCVKLSPRKLEAILAEVRSSKRPQN